MTEIDEATRYAVALRVATLQQIPQQTALDMVNDVCERWHDSPYVPVVAPVIGAILRPILDAVAAADPSTPEGVAKVLAAMQEALPEAIGRDDQQRKLS